MTNVPAHCSCGRSGHCPGPPCNDLLTCRAIPDADRRALHSVLKNSDEGVDVRNAVDMYVIPEKY